MTTIIIASVAAVAISLFVARARSDTVTIYGEWEKARSKL